jgi:hypothetical protein
MVARAHSEVPGCAIAAIVLACTMSAAAGQGPGDLSSSRADQSSQWSNASHGRTDAKELRTWRVHLADPIAARVTHDALERASGWLEQPTCARIVAEFADRAGRPLSERLEALGMDAQSYLPFVLFFDGTSDLSCRTGVVARAVPGSRAVRLCGEELKRIWRQDQSYTVATLLHEMLHTLGLGENPPSSKAITRRVLDRCHPD